MIYAEVENVVKCQYLFVCCTALLLKNYQIYSLSLINIIIATKMQQGKHRIEQLLTILREIDANIRHKQIPNKVILLMGATKAGKTTLYYYLLGKKLIREENQLGVWQMRPDQMYFSAIIGNGYDSATVNPNISSQLSQNGVMIIDMPGFDDSRNHFKLLKIYILLQVFKLAKKVHMCYVIPEENCNSDALINEFQKISSIFNAKIIENQHFLSFIITKVENEDIQEYFFVQIQDLVESQLINHLKNQAEAFKAKHVYQFPNQYPDVERGLILRQKIQKENQFYEVDYNPFAILKQTYCQEIIGKSNVLQFKEYVLLIIKDINAISATLFQIYANIIKLQYHQAIAYALNINSERYLQQLKSSLIKSSSEVTLFKFNQIEIKIASRKQWIKEHPINLLKIFQTNDLSTQDNTFLPKMLTKFSVNINLIKNSSSIFQQEYLSKLQQFLKEISTLMSIIAEIKQEYISLSIKQLTKAQNILKPISKLNKIWKQNKQSILRYPKFRSFSNLPQLSQILGDKNSSFFQQVIHIMPKYSQPKKKKDITDIVTKTSQKQTKSDEVYYLLDHTDFVQHPQETNKVLKGLPISYLSLRQLKNQYDALDKNEQKYLVRKVLNKISQIFYWFSYFEQAIALKMATADQNGILSLLQEGISCSQISPDFIQTILIPYYSQINISKSRLQTCFNYLLHLAQTPQEYIQTQQRYVQILTQATSGPQYSYLLQQRYKQLELYYIHPIMQSFQYYLQQMQKKQLAFNQSPIASLTGFINKTMRL